MDILKRMVFSNIMICRYIISCVSIIRRKLPYINDGDNSYCECGVGETSGTILWHLQHYDAAADIQGDQQIRSYAHVHVHEERLCVIRYVYFMFLNLHLLTRGPIILVQFINIFTDLSWRLLNSSIKHEIDIDIISACRIQPFIN